MLGVITNIGGFLFGYDTVGDIYTLRYSPVSQLTTVM